MRTFFNALRLTLLLTVITGLIYPLAVFGLAQMLFPDQARGSLVALVFVTALALSAGVVPAQVGTGRAAPDFAGSPWLNSPPLTIVGLRGRVVLV